jgi:hypothetical protein
MRPFLFFVFISAFIFESCNSIYVPATPSTPVFGKGNSFKINTTVGASGLNASLDYSPITHYYLGGEVHGMKLMALDSNRHLNAGGHIGYYFSPGDEDSHLNFQIGYNFGNCHYADVFDSAESHLYSCSAVYETYHAQSYYVHDFRHGKFFGFGVRYDLYRVNGKYTDVYNHFFTKSIPVKTSVPMAFAFFEYPFGRHSVWNLNMFGGVQLSTNRGEHNFVGQDVPGFYTYFVFRIGIAYQIHFGKN